MDKNKWDLEQIMPINDLHNYLKKTLDEIKMLKSEILSLSPEIDSKLFTKVINHFENFGNFKDVWLMSLREKVSEANPSMKDYVFNYLLKLRVHLI